MAGKLRKWFFGIALLTGLLGLSSCTLQEESLYSLPQQSEEYIELQAAINRIIAGGAEYAAPTSGTNRQTVQLRDLDGDGAEEAIAFFRVSGERPLRIYIFENIGDNYQVATIIEGDGTNIARIDYADLTGSGEMNIIVGWQVSAGLQMVSVYSLDNLQSALLMSTDYYAYTIYDADKSGDDELAVLHLETAELTSSLELYDIDSQGMIFSTSARLSNGVTSADRMRTGYMEGNLPVLLVEGQVNETELITDVFYYDTDGIQNISMDATGVSTDTLRSYNAYSSDINQDGLIDVPDPQLLPAAEEGAADMWIIQWYNYDRWGNRHLAISTYHNYTDEWYLELPEEWIGHITIRRNDAQNGERAVIFSWIDEEEGLQDFLQVYTLTGDNREDRASLPGRFVLATEDETIYAAEILTDAETLVYTPTPEEIRSWFHIIYSEWITG